MWSNWNSHRLLVGMQNGAAMLEKSLRVSYKVNIHLTYNPTIPLLICPQERGQHVHTKTWIQMLIAALVTSATTKNNLNIQCLMVGEQTVVCSYN